METDIMKDDLPLISIIVPVYNVHKYIDRCIKSLINQDYKNREIILVDDGSTDESSEICRQYSIDFSDITYYRQQNRGLSAARNTGLSLAHGDFVMFVDSDDYVDSTFCSNAVLNQQEFKSDVVIFGFYRETTTTIPCLTLGKQSRNLTLEEAATDLIKDSYAWNKLYRKSLFDSVKYPVGKTYEDGYTTYRLYDQSNVISYCAKTTYHYVETGQSIVSSKSPANIRDQFGAVVKIFSYLQDKYPQVSKNYYYEFVISAIRYLTYVPSDYDHQLYKVAYNVLKKCRVPRELDLTHKLSLMMFKLSSPLAVIIFKLRRN